MSKVRQYEVTVLEEVVGMVESNSSILYRIDDRKPTGEIISNGSIGTLVGRDHGYSWTVKADQNWHRKDLNGMAAKVSIVPVWESETK